MSHCDDEQRASASAQYTERSSDCDSEDRRPQPSSIAQIQTFIDWRVKRLWEYLVKGVEHIDQFYPEGREAFDQLNKELHALEVGYMSKCDCDHCKDIREQYYTKVPNGLEMQTRHDTELHDADWAKQLAKLEEQRHWARVGPKLLGVAKQVLSINLNDHSLSARTRMAMHLTAAIAEAEQPHGEPIAESEVEEAKTTPSVAVLSELLVAVRRLRYFEQTGDTPNSSPWKGVDDAIERAEHYLVSITGNKS